MDVSDRNLQPKLTQQAKMPTKFPQSVGIFAFAGFVSGLRPRASHEARGLICRERCSETAREISFSARRWIPGG